MIRSTINSIMLLVLVAFMLVGLLALNGATLPGPVPVSQPTPLPTLTPTATLTPGWWDEVDFATPTLKPLPGLPEPAFGGVGGAAPGQPVSFAVLTCPTASVQISDIRTAPGPWWHIFGTASIANLWYWKAEVSADGAHWALLYRSEQPVMGGLLVRLNLTTVPAGPLQLRLLAVDGTGNYPAGCAWCGRGE